MSGICELPHLSRVRVGLPSARAAGIGAAEWMLLRIFFSTQQDAILTTKPSRPPSSFAESDCSFCYSSWPTASISALGFSKEKARQRELAGLFEGLDQPQFRPPQILSDRYDKITGIRRKPSCRPFWCAEPPIWHLESAGCSIKFEASKMDLHQ